MQKQKLDKETKRAIRDARKIIEAIYQADGNEAETRRRVERIFETLMGYDVLKHLSRERAVFGVSGTEHVDFSIQVEEEANAQPVVLIELKRVGVELLPKHLKQVAGYAIDFGCEWILLTNGREWRLYHVEFGKPPVTKLVERWNLLHDEPEVLAQKFSLISFKHVKRGGLDKLWKRTEVLQPRSLLKAILSPEALRDVRRVIKRDTGVIVTADDVVGALRKMLNENAARVLQNVEVTFPATSGSKRTRKTSPRVALENLIKAGLLSAGAAIFANYKGERYEATIQGDGTIVFEGNSYKTLSAAGGAITAKYNVNAPNGWDFWQFTSPDGEAKPLDALRQRFLSLQMGASGRNQATQT